MKKIFMIFSAGLVVVNFSLQAGCQVGRREQVTYDRGYWQGASDAIKRHYWARQQDERRRVAIQGETVYYVYEQGPEEKEGRQLTPSKEVLKTEEGKP